MNEFRKYNLVLICLGKVSLRNQLLIIPTGRDSGTDFRVPEIALVPVGFRLIFLRFFFVVSDRVDI